MTWPTADSARPSTISRSREPCLLPTFPHTQSAHCESGVAANLLTHRGLPVSEAMAFGIGSGIFFGYLPFIRINGLPLVTYRAAAGHMLKKIAAIPGVSLIEKKFSSQAEAMAELDQALDALDGDRDFLKAGDVFSDDLIDGYIALKMKEVTRFRMSTHPVEFDMYYSS